MLSIHPSPANLTLPTLPCALKDDFGEAIVACGMPKLCKFPSLDICQKSFLWTYNEVALALHPVIGLVFQIENAEKFLQAVASKSLDPFFQSQQAGSMFHSHRGGWWWQRDLYRVAPKYLKLVTSSNFGTFMLISALLLFVLLVMILLFFSVLTSFPYAVALSTCLLVRSWSSPLLPPRRIICRRQS